MGLVHTPFHLFEGADAVAEEATRRILLAAEQAVAERGRFHIVLAGGGTPQSVYRRLAQFPAAWAAWRVYFGDERCLPADHPERNNVAATRTLLGQVPIPAQAVYAMAAELGPEAAAAAYAPLVARALPFDLVLLGMGEDGHTASLFPGHAVPDGHLVIPVHDAPKPPADRVSLTPAALTSAREVLILVTGASKREALAAWRDGADLPVARVARAAPALVLVDRAAAGTDLAPSPLPPT